VPLVGEPTRIGDLSHSDRTILSVVTAMSSAATRITAIDSNVRVITRPQMEQYIRIGAV
jgi:hypothetical protein